MDAFVIAEVHEDFLGSEQNVQFQRAVGGARVGQWQREEIPLGESAKPGLVWLGTLNS